MRLLPHGQYGAGLRLLPCGQYAYAVRLLRLRRNTTHLCAYCPTGNTALAPAIALQAIRLRCSSIAATPQYDSPMRLLPHRQYGADMNKKKHSQMAVLKNALAKQ